MDTIRKAEERSREAARHGLERARSSWEDTERALRRRMRIYPGQKQKTARNGGTAATPAAPAKDAGTAGNPVQGEPIVSIHGKDVIEPEPTTNRKTA